MKKTMVHIALMLALVFSLSACSNTKGKDNLVDNTVPTAQPSPTVTVTPMITPDADNGTVTDGDGIIDDNTVKDDVRDDIANDADAAVDAVPADSSIK